MQVMLSRALQADIFRHLEATYPTDGGGFLLGELAGQDVRVTEIVQVENVFAAEEQYHRYAMRPQDWARLEDQADSRGLGLVGYYHSHPDSPAVPSVYDRDHAWPHFVYLITSVQGGSAAEMLAWRLRPDRTQFDAETLVVD